MLRRSARRRSPARRLRLGRRKALRAAEAVLRGPRQQVLAHARAHGADAAPALAPSGMARAARLRHRPHGSREAPVRRRSTRSTSAAPGGASSSARSRACARRILCFNGKRAASEYLGRRQVGFGLQTKRIADTASSWRPRPAAPRTAPGSRRDGTSSPSTSLAAAWARRAQPRAPLRPPPCTAARGRTPSRAARGARWSRS